MKHRRTREQDEYVCTCGYRWGVKEPDPHDRRKPRHLADDTKQENNKLFGNKEWW